MKLKNLYILLGVVFLISIDTLAQDRFTQMQNQLQLIAIDNPGLENTVDLSVNGVSLQEFIRGIANANDLNISVDDGLNNIQIINNFSNVTVSDVLIFLAKRYQLEMEFVGNIISISKYNPPPEPLPPPQPKVINVNYDERGDLLTLDLSNDNLVDVIRKVTSVSDKNIVLSPNVENKKVSVFIQRMPFNAALQKFAYSNGMSLTETDDGFFVLSELGDEKVLTSNENEGTKTSKEKYKRKNIEGLFLEVSNENEISISAENVSIDEVVKAVAYELDIDYYLFSKIEGTKTLNLKAVSLEELLNNLFEATAFTYKKNYGVYLIGERKSEGLRTTTVYQMQHRSIENIMEVIPNDLKQELELKKFADLNSLVISGSRPMAEELIQFLKQIDQVVPVIAIDVIIVGYRKNRSLSAGITAGLGEPTERTEGSFVPETDVNFSAKSVNDIIENINQSSIVNLGKVTPNFYFSIKALEQDGVLKVRSTPKLATLNGHEANLSVGNTEYYVEESNNVIGAQNPQNIITRTYRPVEADLAITIKPLVSGNDQITLEITVEQSDFTERISNEAPPGKVSRSFSSMLRVKNNEMVLLGGLEEKSVNNSGAGLPFLARIPIIRWFFGQRTRSKNKSQLNIFIKPTVIY